MSQNKTPYIYFLTCLYLDLFEAECSCFSEVTDVRCLMTHSVWKLVHQTQVTLHANQSRRERGRARGKTDFLKATSWTRSSTLPRQRSLQTFTQSWRKCEYRDCLGSNQERRACGVFGTAMQRMYSHVLSLSVNSTEWINISSDWRKTWKPMLLTQREKPLSLKMLCFC